MGDQITVPWAYADHRGKCPNGLFNGVNPNVNGMEAPTQLTRNRRLSDARQAVEHDQHRSEQPYLRNWKNPSRIITTTKIIDSSGKPSVPNP